MKKIIPKYVPKRSHIDIENIVVNKFELLDENIFNNSFVFTINYLDTHKIKLNILQLSDFFVKIKKINILIYSLDLSENQIITCYLDKNIYEFEIKKIIIN